MSNELPSRELLLHSLYEAAELEHNLMCTYLYAAFSLKGDGEGLTDTQLEAVKRWRNEIIAVAIEEMSHLTAVWNITAALGGAPRFGRTNFPLDPGMLPAGIVVKLAPFNEHTLQHFIFLERPGNSNEPEGKGFEPERAFQRSSPVARLVPMGTDYATVGEFYETLAQRLTRFVEAHGDAVAFCGRKHLQLSRNEVNLPGATPVICLKTALQALDAIVLQGEGAAEHSANSHFARFVAIRTEFEQLLKADPTFSPAHPAATNPVLRRPPKPEGRVWVNNPIAASTVDVANASYQLMLRMLAYSYTLHSDSDAAEKALTVDLSLKLMRAVTLLGEQAARLSAADDRDPNRPLCNAGMSFTALRDASAFADHAGARQFIIERLQELDHALSQLAATLSNVRTQAAYAITQQTVQRAKRGYEQAAQVQQVPQSTKATQAIAAPPAASTAVLVDGVETVEGKALTLHFEAKRCIHARFCVTGAPTVFLANVKGPWLHPDAIPVERLVDIAHACPSGAINYARKDGQANESAPLVNLISVRENGPYAVRAAMEIDGEQKGFRATLCRCGASKNKPYCDGSHHDIHFNATGEPATGINGLNTDMLAVRDGPLSIDLEIDGPLSVRGNLEMVSGTGRMVCRVGQAKLCRCGGSATKPFCDGTHRVNGFKS